MLFPRPLSTWLILCLLALAGPKAIAQDEPSFTDPVVAKLNERAMRFLNEIAERRESDAFKDLLSGSALADQTGAVKTLIDRAKELSDRYGTYRGSEAIRAKRVGKDLVMLKHLYKCEKFPVVWHIAFYRDLSRGAMNSDDQWIVISLRFDTQLDALLP